MDGAEEVRAWVRRFRGAQVDATAPSTGEGERGLVAASDLEPGAVVVAVPEPCLVTLERLEAEGRLRNGLSATASLALWLLEERASGAASPSSPYLRSLPLAYPTPETWGADWRGLRARACRFEASQVSALRTATSLPLDHVRWALGTVATRSCFWPGRGGMCLVPFGDLLNHENPAPEAPADLGALFGFDQTSRAYVFRAQRRFAKGEEIFISYGRKANVELLSIYGFALEENEYDCVPLRANARLHALLPDVGRWAAVEESAIQGKWEIGWLNGAAAVSFPLLAALAHLCAGVPTIQHAVQNQYRYLKPARLRRATN